MQIYKAINEWLLNYTPLNNWIYFNATPIITGTVAMNMVAGDRVTKEYIDGTKQKQCVFAIDMISEYDGSGTSDVNMDALAEVESFMDWLEIQNKENNFPNFGEKCITEKVEVLTNVPQLLINEQSQLAKYQFQARVNYKDESEVM